MTRTAEPNASGDLSSTVNTLTEQDIARYYSDLTGSGASALTAAAL
jgi:hypothetical protein